MWGLPVELLLEKDKTAIQGDESEDVEILDFPEERQPIVEPPVREPATEEAPFEIALGNWPRPSSKVDFPTIKGSLAEPTVTVVTSHMEIVSSAMVGMTTAITSAPLGNDSAVDFVYVVISFFDSKASFAGTLELTVPIAGSGSS